MTRTNPITEQLGEALLEIVKQMTPEDKAAVRRELANEAASRSLSESDVFIHWWGVFSGEESFSSGSPMANSMS
jgi:hypothetical protein